MDSEDGSLFIKVHERCPQIVFSAYIFRSGYELTRYSAESCLLRPNSRTSAGKCSASSATTSTKCPVVHIIVWREDILTRGTYILVLFIEWLRSSTLLSIPWICLNERQAGQIDSNTSPSLLSPLKVRRVGNIGWTYECPVRELTFGKLANQLCLISGSNSAPKGEKL